MVILLSSSSYCEREIIPGRIVSRLNCFGLTWIYSPSKLFSPDCTLKKPQIIVGERRCHGLVIHSRETYNRLYERIKKAFVRKEVVTLMVME